MNLHGQIMNIKCEPGNVAAGFDAGTLTRDQVMHYRLGHRDACHAAAELALLADAINAELLAALKEVFSLESQLLRDIYGSTFVDNARAAIAAATGEQA